MDDVVEKWACMDRCGCRALSRRRMAQHWGVFLQSLVHFRLLGPED